VWTLRFRDLVDALRRPDRAILVASHNLDELERLTDRVAIVDRGKLVRIVDTRQEVSGTSVTRYRISYRGDEGVVRDVFPAATMPAPNEIEVRVTGLEELNRALVALIGRGVLVSSATPAYSALEEHFRQAVRNDG
jgi:ABC-type multidrug transport system ATPase subunit